VSASAFSRRRGISTVREEGVVLEEFWRFASVPMWTEIRSHCGRESFWLEVPPLL